MPIEVGDAWIAQIKEQIGELPAARRKRYVEALGLPAADAVILASDRATGDFFEQAIAAGGASKRVANLLLGQGKRIANERNSSIAQLGIAPLRFAEIAQLIDANKLAASSAGPLLDAMLSESDTPAEQLATTLNLIQVSDAGPIDIAIDALIADNPKSLQDYRGGKQAAFGSLVGMIIKQVKGANPKLVQERLRQKLA